MSVSSSLSSEKIIAYNQYFEAAIKETGGATELQKIFSGAVTESNPFVAKLEDLGVFKKQTKLEDNIAHLVDTLALAETRIRQKGAKADPQEIEDVKKFGRYLNVLIKLGSSQSTKEARALSKPSPLLNLKIRKFTTLDTKLQGVLSKLNAFQAEIESSKTAHVEKTAARGALQGYEEILKSELGFNTRSLQSLHKNRHTAANSLNAYLTKLEALETKPSKSLVASVKTYLGYGEQTELGQANRGSLARGMYTTIYNRLAECARDLRVIQSQSKFADVLARTGATLEEARQLQLAQSATKLAHKNKPEVIQAERACQLLKLRDFITKAHFFLETKGKVSRATDAEFTKLYQRLGVKGNEPFSAERLKSVTTAELEQLSNTITADVEKLLQDEDGYIGWSQDVIREDMSTQSWNKLCSEMVDGHAKLR